MHSLESGCLYRGIAYIDVVYKDVQLYYAPNEYLGLRTLTFGTHFYTKVDEL